jgi:hypothetical protein
MSTAPIILNDLTEQKTRIDGVHATLKALAKRFPNYVEKNMTWFIEMAGELCAATFCNERGDYVLAEFHYEKAENSIGHVDYKLNDAASDLDL